MAWKQQLVQYDPAEMMRVIGFSCGNLRHSAPAAACRLSVTAGVGYLGNMSPIDWLQILLGFRYFIRRAIASVTATVSCKGQPEARLVAAESAENAE